MILDITRPSRRKAKTFSAGLDAYWDQLELPKGDLAITFVGRPAGKLVGYIGVIDVVVIDDVITYVRGKNKFADPECDGYKFVVSGNKINGIDVGCDVLTLPRIAIGAGFTSAEIKLDSNGKKRNKRKTSVKTGLQP